MGISDGIMGTMSQGTDISGWADWAAQVSQSTNRSLAGASIRLPQGIADASALATAAAQWGMSVATPEDSRNATFDATCDPQTIPDARDLDGAGAMAHAQEHMRVLRALMDEFTKELDFTGVRIAVCLVLEPKTAVLLRELKRAGATVGVFCEPSDTDPRVIEPLRAEGIAVEADPAWGPEETHAGALRLLDHIRPHIIIDDGASFARLAALERPELLTGPDGLIGVAEETTSGVRAFQAMQDAGALSFPVVAVNDSVLKTGFDNEHGTGETCVTTMQEILGTDAFAGARVTVVGYGPVGRGFARRIRALGAQVTICDVDPVAALKAVFDGFATRDLTEAAATADIVVSATGVRHTVTTAHMRAMREHAVLAVIGGIANEIALDEIPGFRPEPGRPIRELTVPDGPTLRLLAEGDGVNYTAGGGNPIEIMDLSFAVQASAVAHLLRSHAAGTLSPGLTRLGTEADRRIASIALAVRGQSTSRIVADNGYDWTLTRFADAPKETR